ncbi:hypothetical protein J2Z66_001293 [Paenibacillus eucommiae]|uniref:Uncharacterized protein n=1 Tax=Paenibacillus eucommiae TaxID=1355755 RepID=A0ABS4IRD6_9BACL|nr:hypothetical protein [Paenibacillus eucommiae]
MHLHFYGTLDFKKVRTSALIIIFALLVLFALDLIIHIPTSLRLYIYAIPFFIHVLCSLFMSKKESWLLGGMMGTLVSMVVIVIVLFTLM